tara:strand:+ start:329 stop:598 length:270 start_codon:yes stop_codon:yes gene_type:complete
MVTREMGSVHIFLTEKIREYYDRIESREMDILCDRVGYGGPTLAQVKADIKDWEVQLNWMIKLNNEYRVVLQERAKAFGPQLKGSFYDL